MCFAPEQGRQQRGRAAGTRFGGVRGGAKGGIPDCQDKEYEMWRLFLPVKSNIGNDQTRITFELQSAQVGSPAGVITPVT
jgi:hypothetical protein